MRSLFFILLSGLTVVNALGQSTSMAADDDSSIMPVVIAVVMLVAAVCVRLISKKRSAKA